MPERYSEKLKEIIYYVTRQLRKNQTPAEAELWSVLRKKQLDGIKFYRQHPIKYQYQNRDSFFIADFFTHQNKIIIELDGPVHEYRVPYDVERTHILSMMGYKVIRFANDEVLTDINAVLRTIKIKVSSTSGTSA